MTIKKLKNSNYYNYCLLLFILNGHFYQYKSSAFLENHKLFTHTITVIVVIRYSMYSTNTNPTKADRKCYVSQQPNGLMKATFLTTAPATTLNSYPIENQVYDLRLEVHLLVLIFFCWTDFKLVSDNNFCFMFATAPERFSINIRRQIIISCRL